MTALEASASTRTRAAIRAQAQVIDHVTVSDRLVHDVLLGWPARADSVRVVLDAARASGVDVGTVPARTEAERAEWTAKRQGKRPCHACSAKDAELAKLRAEVERLSEGIGIAQRERGEARDELAKARSHLVEQMQDWKRQWLEVCAERDDVKAHLAALEETYEAREELRIKLQAEVAALRARVAELEARPVAAAEQRRQEREARLRERGYDQDPPRDPFVAPPSATPADQWAHLHVPQGPGSGVSAIMGAMPDAPEPECAPAPPNPAPQPDATTEALARAVGRPCTVRIDLGDGVLVRAAEVAG